MQCNIFALSPKKVVGCLEYIFYMMGPAGRVVMFCYYLLGGGNAVPSWLRARLCHAFLVCQ